MVRGRRQEEGGRRWGVSLGPASCQHGGSPSVETFSDLLCAGTGASELMAGSVEVPGGRGCRAKVQVCGCVHKRGPE